MTAPRPPLTQPDVPAHRLSRIPLISRLWDLSVEVKFVLFIVLAAVLLAGIVLGGARHHRAVPPGPRREWSLEFGR